MSAGDAQDLAKKDVDRLLSIGEMEKLDEEDPLSQSIERELKKLESDESGGEKKKSVSSSVFIVMSCMTDNGF